MPVEIRVPPLGESLVDAVVGQWLKSEGDTVSRGDTLLELETDKVNLDVAATGIGQSAIFGHQIRGSSWKPTRSILRSPPPRTEC